MVTFKDAKGNTVMTTAKYSKRTEEPDILRVPKSLEKDLDTYVAAKNLIDETEEKQNLSKKPIIEWCRKEYAKRAMRGVTDNFKIETPNSRLLFVFQSRSRAFDEGDIELFQKVWGKKATENLLEDGEPTLNKKVWELHKDDIMKALKAVDARGNRILPDAIVENLIQTGKKKAVSNVITEARKYVDDEKDLERLYTELQLTTQLKS